MSTLADNREPGATALALDQRPEERLSALERLEVLTDPGSLMLVRTRASSAPHG